MAGASTAQGGKGSTGGVTSSQARPPEQDPPGRAPGRRLGVRARLLIAAGAVALVGGAALWLLYGSPWLRVREVSVSGTDVLSAREVRTAAAVPLGSPLVSVDTGAVSKNTRGALTRIESLEIDRSWPRTLTIKVTERKPVLVQEKGGKFDEVDAHGVLFATVGSAPRGIPKLDLDAGDAPSLRRFGTDRLLREAARVAGDLPPSVAPKVRTVKIRSYDAVSLLLSDGRTVEWGSGEKGEAKARALTALMKAAPKAGHFDVSVPIAPAVSGS